MSVANVQGLSVSYGKKVLFDDASFAIGPEDRIGLVGANGTGKSTLLKILAGQLTPDSGTVGLRRRARPGYLPQEITSLPDGTLVETVMSAVPGRDELESKLRDAQAAVEAATEESQQLEWAQVLADLQTDSDHFDERYGRHRAEEILSGLGFSSSDFSRPTTTFSGGWRMRAALAGLLLQDPELLLLDEPTNHLDLPTLTWFDEFLRRSRKAMVLISHDRDFLNRQINRVLSLEVEGLRSYSGNYEEYRRLRALEAADLAARAARQAKKRAETEAFIERFGAKASKARQAQSKQKMLDREEVIETLEERDRVSFTFPEVSRSGREVVTLKGVSKRYGEHWVYRGAQQTLLRGQRVAVVGVNCAGKTTLLKLVAGELAPDEGEVTLGHNVVLGYYAQHHAEALDRTASILDEVWKLVPDKPQSHVRGVLGAFLFSGDDVEKKIGVLSGGDRALVEMSNLLFLHEILFVL
jgi:ATP-binding cassette subfamily F protein 3